MNFFYETKHHHVTSDTFNYEVLSSAKAQVSFQAPPFQSSLNCLKEGYNLTEVNGSCSDSSSAGSLARSMSMSDKTVGDERLSHPTDGNMPYTSTCGHGDTRSHTQLASTQCNNSSVNDMQQQTYDFRPTQIAAPMPGCVYMLPIPVQVYPMMISQPQSSKSTQVCYPMNQHQSPGIQQNRATMPILSNAFSKMMHPSRYSQLNNAGTSSNLTPAVNYFSGSPYSVYSHGYMNTPGMPNSSIPVSEGMKYPVEVSNLEVDRMVVQHHSLPEQNSLRKKQIPTSSKHLRTTARTVNKSKAFGNASEEPATEKCSVSIEKPQKNREKKTEKKILVGERDEDDDLWPGSCTYIVNKESAGSSLFATWSGSSSELVDKLQLHNFKVNHVRRTIDDQVRHVVFDNHASARKAFTMQCVMCIRMVPPKKNTFKWLRNPSPRFLVMFETKRPLIMRKGKAQSHDIVGELLMSNGKEQKGCLIWADQLKRHRIRVLMCEGNFKLPGGRIVQLKRTSKSEIVSNIPGRETSLGWISYRSSSTKEMFVIRRSGNLLSDYIYRG